MDITHLRKVCQEY